MNHVLKALSALLAYPDEPLQDAVAEIRSALAGERRWSAAVRADLERLLTELGAGDLYELQEAYVATFDRGRSCALNLFEHVHGESRDRGQAMVDLERLYASAGFTLVARELPDYLPAMLEFLALRPAADAAELLGDCGAILRRLGCELRRRHSPYHAVFAALLSLAGLPGLEADADGAVEEAEDLDAEWVDPPVIFGPGPTGCGATAEVAPLRYTPRGERRQ